MLKIEDVSKDKKNKPYKLITLWSCLWSAMFLAQDKYKKGWPVLTLKKIQCLGVKGLGVEIFSFVFFINCSLYQNKLFLSLTFGQFHQNSGVIVQKLNKFLSTGC